MATKTKYEVTFCNGDEAEIYDTLEEAKEVVDKWRVQCEMDYGLIRTVSGSEDEKGDWGEFEEEWEKEYFDEKYK